MKRQALTATGKNGYLLKRVFTLLLAFTLPLTVMASVGIGSSAEQQSDAAASVEISNFGKVNEHYYRGAQPEGKDYKQLAAIGVKTIIDLRDDAKGYAKPLAEQAGLHYINLPMKDTKYPATDTASRFLVMANNSENWPIYVHCAGGRHRTGAMTAVYRMTIDGWDIGQAYQEMKQYDFYTRWGHGALKDYVYDYYREFKQKQSQLLPQSEAKK